MNKRQAAEQLRRALQMFVQTLDDDKAQEVSTVFPSYMVGKTYEVNELFTYGVNSVGDPQLYRAVQTHVSSAEWIPSENPTLYTPIGLTEEGHPIWSQPTGSHDAYNIGDVVEYKGELYKSLIDGNVYSPESYPSGWEVVTE